MAHAGTIDLGRREQRANGRNPRLAAATVLALAAIAAMYLGTASGLTSGNPAARTAADRSYDQIEAQRGAIALPVAGDRSYDQIESQRTLIGAPLSTGALPFHPHGRVVVDGLVGTAPGATQIPSGTFHTGLPSAPEAPMTSGTFHSGLPAPVQRDRVGGP
jgi:hypothetical protein